MTFDPNLTLETERLILRIPRAEDLDPWSAMMADEEVARFIGGVMGREQTWRVLAAVTGSWVLQGFSMFSVIEKSSGRWVGRIGPWRPDGWPGTEIGWGLSRHSWGKGYAVEAAAACMDFAVDVLGWTDIIHTIDPENVGSQQVAQRLGSANRGTTRLPPPLDGYNVEAWAQTADQWRARRSAR